MNIYKCENCYRRLLCDKARMNNYCQDFLLDNTKISLSEHIMYKVKFRHELLKNRILEYVDNACCPCVKDKDFIGIMEWL